jgi:hypothetical protein
MRQMKRRSILVASALLLVSIGYPAYGAIMNGSKCTKAGQVTTVNGQKMTCSLVWVSSQNSQSPGASPKPSKSTSDSIQSKSFRIESVTFNSDLGSAGAEARITNTSRSTKTATMTITIFKSDNKTIAFTMSGVVNAVSPGETVSVTFMSISGEFPPGQFKYTFQVNAEF